MIRGFFLMCFVCVLVFLPRQAQALTIAPLRQTAVVAAGEETTISLFFVNDTNASITVSPEVDGFRVNPETGTAEFGVFDDAVSWVTPLETDVYVRPGETGQFRFLVRPPDDVSVGAHYLGLFATESAGEGQVGIGTRVGSLFFLHIAGQVQESLVVSEFAVTHDDLTNKYKDVSIEIQNTGDIHVVPKGTIVVSNWRGNTVQELLFNTADQKVLSHGSMYRTLALDPLRFQDVGKHEVAITLSYGVTGQTVTMRETFWYIPVGVFMAMGVFGLGIIFFFFWKKKHAFHT